MLQLRGARAHQQRPVAGRGGRTSGRIALGPSPRRAYRLAPRQPEVPSEEQLTPWAAQIQVWLTAERLQMTRIHELLRERGCQFSYNSLRRFIQRRRWRRRPVTMRLAESAPGEVAEFDLSRLGLAPDPESDRRRTVWGLIVALRYSRHCFVWPTRSQMLESVLEGLEAAWAFSEGAPFYLVLDNFPAAIAGADRLHPRLTEGFLKHAQHRGLIADPARPQRPWVERSVSYVRERFFKRGSVPRPRRAARSRPASVGSTIRSSATAPTTG
ncbi:MAG: transposase family protein [Chloroflexi bacterium]|nr:transposase family protein [Chloroflexota bacterium]